MRYENLKQFMEKNPDQFKGFIARKIDITRDINDVIVEFKKPNTNNGAITFVYINGVLTINGDWGNAVFTWFAPQNTLEWIGNLDDMSYIMQKCIASSNSENNKHMIEWDSTLCKKNVLTIIEEAKLEDDEYEVSDTSWRNHTESLFHWNSFLMYNGSTIFGEYWYEMGLNETGAYRNERPMIWWMGLKEALKQLNKAEDLELDEEFILEESTTVKENVIKHIPPTDRPCEVCGNNDVNSYVTASTLGAMSFNTCVICMGVNAEPDGMQDVIGGDYMTYNKEEDRYYRTPTEPHVIEMQDGSKFEKRSEVVEYINTKNTKNKEGK